MQLVWFRQDLRVNDHSALWHAVQAGPCIAIAILSPEQNKLHDDSTVKIQFYLRQLQCLKEQLNALNIPLIIQNVALWQDIPQHLSQLCQALNIECVHANIETGVNEQYRDLQLQQVLAKNHISFEQYTDRTIFPLGSILNKSQQPYQVFGAFKKQCYERLSIQLPTCLGTIEKQAEIHSNALDHLTQIDLSELILDNPIQKLWPVHEKVALEKLNQFIEQDLADYKEQRDFPNIDGTSTLSPYLNIGIVSIRQCLEALFPQGYFEIKDEGQHTWLDELLWREFYQHILHLFPKVSKHMPFKSSTEQLQWRTSPEDLAAWQQGLTGVPVVDAGMRQLLHTGWMHNRVRMICAMFFSKNLLMNWRLGEQWFMQHLIDGDLAANNGGWQWCASTGTDAVPYFRIFNPISQSLKFDPNGEYIRQWLPELSHLETKRIHDPYAKHPNDMKLNYPRPIIDLKSSRTRVIQAFKALNE